MYTLPTRNSFLLTSFQHLYKSPNGPAKIHNERRYLKAGKKPTFETILKNVKDCCEILNINIRANVDKTNMSCVDELFEEFNKNGIKDKISFYISPVSDISENPILNVLQIWNFQKNKWNFI